MSQRFASAAVIAVGDELLAGAHPDLNSSVIAARLGELGIPVRRIDVLPDDEQAIEIAVRRRLDAVSLVVVTGGLGPTLDDVTRHGIARAVGCELREDAGVVDDLRAWFASRAKPMPETNRRQALFPEGAQVLPNRAGTAPGFVFERGDAAVVSLPGPPFEMRVLLEEQLVPWLAEHGGTRGPLAERRFHLFGLAESDFADRAGPWMDRDASPRMGVSAKRGVLSVVIRIFDGRPDEALARLDRRAEAFRERFADHLFSEEEERLEHVLGETLRQQGTTFTTAESCTGGLAASLVTRVPGASGFFHEAYVTYSNESKERLLGVPRALIEAHGAVSAEVAGAMAAGAAARSGARLALAITGIAGPDGGTPDKPVGLVWFGTSLDGVVETESRRWTRGDRNWIRSLAARTGLDLALRRLRRG